MNWCILLNRSNLIHVRDWDDRWLDISLAQNPGLLVIAAAANGLCISFDITLACQRGLPT